MALGTTNIALRAVRTLLGYDADFSLFNIGTSVLINKWSKYKPVRAAGLGANWPAGNGGTYGLDIANNWGYLHPQGGAPGGGTDEPVRLGDFRGYEHNGTLTYPPVYTEDTGPTILYPSGSPYSHNFSPIPVYDSVSSVRIRTSDLGLDGYYLGVKVVGFPGGPWYKTGVQLNSTGNQAISITAEHSDPDSYAYAGLPYVVGAGLEWYLIISDTQKTVWSAVAPTNYYYLPVGTYGGKAMVTTGSFEIKDWVDCVLYGTGTRAETIYFTAAGGNQNVTVWCSYSGGPPDWAASKTSGNLTLTTNDDGTPVAANLVQSEFEVLITASAIPNYSDVVCEHDASDGYTWTMGAESGSITPTLTRADTNVTLTSNSQSRIIVIQQGQAGNDQISFTYNPDGGDDFPPSGATINYQIYRGATQVYPAIPGNWASATGQKSVWNNAIGPLTMTEVAQNDTYTVKIKLM